MNYRCSEGLGLVEKNKKPLAGESCHESSQHKFSSSEFVSHS